MSKPDNFSLMLKSTCQLCLCGLLFTMTLTEEIGYKSEVKGQGVIVPKWHHVDCIVSSFCCVCSVFI